MANRLWLPLGIVAGVMALTAETGAAAVQSKCVVAKSKCVAKNADGVLKCEQKAETPGKPLDPNTDGCVTKVQDKFDGGAEPAKGCIEKLESKTPNDCVTADDTASLDALVDQCVATLVAAIDPGDDEQSKCGVGKMKCAQKKLGGLLKCHQKSETPGKPMDPNAADCVTKVKAKFDGGADPAKGCFTKLEAKSGNDCLPPLGNQADVELLVDACTATIVAALESAPTTTTTTVPTTTSTSTTSSTVSPTTTTSTIIATTTTTAPTTSTTTSAPTTTTSTTVPSGAACGAMGLNVTVGIDYPESLLGGVSAIRLRLAYVPPLSIPGSGNVLSVRQRVTNLAGSGSSVSPNDMDTNGNAVDDLLDVQARASATGSIDPGPVFRVRFDCPAGNVVPASALACTRADATALDGLPFPPELASQITCSVSVATAP